MNKFVPFFFLFAVTNLSGGKTGLLKKANRNTMSPAFFKHNAHVNCKGSFVQFTFVTKRKHYNSILFRVSCVVIFVDSILKLLFVLLF
jgi:hypothetical protein